MTHDAAFAEFREDRARTRAQEVRVTWRRVSADTGGGWSGLGPDGLLVYVGPPTRGELRLYEYGRREGDRKVAGGSRATLTEAKRAAELLMRRMAGRAPYQAHPGDIHGKDGQLIGRKDMSDAEFLAPLLNDAATAAEGSTMSSTTTPNLTEALADGIGEVAGTEKGSIRILAYGHRLGHRLAYVNPRKDSIRLDISARDVEEAPARFQKMMGDTDKRGYRALNVTEKNLKGARALMEWIARQAA